jgi:hypothetical protein
VHEDPPDTILDDETLNALLERPFTELSVDDLMAVKAPPRGATCPDCRERVDDVPFVRYSRSRAPMSVASWDRFPRLFCEWRRLVHNSRCWNGSVYRLCCPLSGAVPCRLGYRPDRAGDRPLST